MFVWLMVCWQLVVSYRSLGMVWPTFAFVKYLHAARGMRHCDTSS